MQANRESCTLLDHSIPLLVLNHGVPAPHALVYLEMKDARTLPTEPASMRVLDMAMPRVRLKEHVDPGLTVVLHQRR